MQHHELIQWDVKKLLMTRTLQNQIKAKLWYVFFFWLRVGRKLACWKFLDQTNYFNFSARKLRFHEKFIRNFPVRADSSVFQFALDLIWFSIQIFRLFPTLPFISRVINQNEKIKSVGSFFQLHCRPLCQHDGHFLLRFSIPTAVLFFSDGSIKYFDVKCCGRARKTFLNFKHVVEGTFSRNISWRT